MGKGEIPNAFSSLYNYQKCALKQYGSMSNSNKVYKVCTAAPRCEQGDKEHVSSVKKPNKKQNRAGGLYAVYKSRLFCQQMQVSPSVALRGTRLWNKPGDLRSPCLSQNAMRMGHLRRSVLDQQWLFPPYQIFHSSPYS